MPIVYYRSVDVHITYLFSRNMKYLKNICDRFENMLFFENDQPSISICIEFFLAVHGNLEELLTKYENVS
jgi:hypothetical protein